MAESCFNAKATTSRIWSPSKPAWKKSLPGRAKAAKLSSDSHLPRGTGKGLHDLVDANIRRGPATVPGLRPAGGDRAVRVGRRHAMPALRLLALDAEFAWAAVGLWVP